MAIHRYLINLLWLYTKSTRSLICGTNSKLDLSHAVSIAYFFYRLPIHHEAEDQFTSLHITVNIWGKGFLCTEPLN